jgi:hypothetical protein
MVKKAVITHLNIKKTGFLAGVVLGTLGLLAATADTLFNGVTQGLLAPTSTYLFPGLGDWGVVLLPVFGFVTGFLLGALTAFVFNMAGRLMGGMDIEITEKPDKDNNQLN